MAGEDLNPDGFNPYAAPESAIGDPPVSPRWRLAPSTIMAVFGVGSLAIGLRLAMVAVNDWMIGDPRWRDMVVICVVWLASGGSWAMAAFHIWKQRYWKGLLLVFVGILIPIALIPLYRGL